MTHASSAVNCVLITGGAQRLGKAMALRFARQGWDIALHYHRSHKQALQTAAEIEALGRRCALVQGDLSDAQDRKDIFTRSVEQLGQLDAIINNASLFEYDNASQFSAELLNQHLGPNLVAPIELAQQLQQHIQPHHPQRQGVVINLLDQKLWGYNPDFFSYTLCKAALQSATTMLAQGLAPYVRVVGLAPGLTMPSHLQSEDDFARTHALAPLGRASTPDDIANAALMLAENPSITGSSLVVDGGQHLMGLQRDFSLL
ncbi:SDR family oxidoreductase [Paenalcaligenes sp. Me52]|uniref:SDR family oxidoreductase n=1 Tax=Paenalcaligenes sp. Me52 TaxID=3392038 RepID=UPI003D26505C